MMTHQMILLDNLNEHKDEIIMKDKLWHPELIKFLPNDILNELRKTLLRIIYLRLDSQFIDFVYTDKLENFYKYYLLAYEELTHRGLKVPDYEFKEMLKYTNMSFTENDSRLVRNYDYHNKTLNPYPIQLNDDKLMIDYYELKEYYLFRRKKEDYPNELFNKLKQFMRSKNKEV